MKNKTDCYIAIVILILVVWGFIHIADLGPAPQGSKYGPAFFPNLILSFIGICALGLLYSAFRTAPRNAESNDLGLKAFNKVAIFTVIFLIYVAAFVYIGFALPSVLFLVAAQFLFGRRAWVNMSIVSVASVGITHLILTYAFMVQLP